MTHLHLSYNNSSISNIESLSKCLGVPEKVLIEVAEKRDSYYKENEPEIKSNGKKRITYSLDKRLKIIQKKIKVKIFNSVYYPDYLQGSIKDKLNPRTYEKNAAIHAGAKLIISEDVSNFFPSIDEKIVCEMWKYLFGFSVEVSKLLTKLTTYKGSVPQGGVTSSYISNLIMWDLEPALVMKLDSMGLTYTRYIDDVTISSRLQWIPKEKIEISIKSIYAMLKAKGVNPNRTKHQIMGGDNKMVIHNLNVNSGRPTLNKVKRQKIRLEVFNLKKLSIVCNKRGKKYEELFKSVNGKVLELCKFHPSQGEKYLDELNSIRPIITEIY